MKASMLQGTSFGPHTELPLERLFAFLWQGLPLPVSLIDRHHRILHCNEAFLQGVHEAPFASPLFECPGFEELRPQFDRIFLHGEAASVSEISFTPASRWQGLLLHHIPIPDQTGEPAWIATFWQELLPPARGQEPMASILSHELRTPLNFITGFASLMEEEIAGPLNEEQHHYMERILEGSTRMTGLIEKLIDHSQTDQEELPLSREECTEEALRRLCEEVVERFKGQALAKEQDLAFDWFGTFPPLKLDQARIQQALEHLLDNALKFTPPRGSIEVSVEGHEHGLAFQIQDSGPGIPPERLHRIFDPFYQVDMTTRRTAGGAGLGLCVVSRIIAAHEGRLGVESILDRGATFWFTLPSA